MRGSSRRATLEYLRLVLGLTCRSVCEKVIRGAIAPCDDVFHQLFVLWITGLKSAGGRRTERPWILLCSIRFAAPTCGPERTWGCASQPLLTKVLNYRIDRSGRDGLRRPGRLAHGKDARRPLREQMPSSGEPRCLTMTRVVVLHLTDSEGPQSMVQGPSPACTRAGWASGPCPTSR